MVNKFENNELYNYIRKYSPFIIFFAAMLFLHLFMGLYRDDTTYSMALTQRSLFDYLIFRYNTWTSRIIIDGILAILTRQNMIVWSLIDTFLYTISAYYVIKIVNRKQNKNLVIIGLLLFLIYPFLDMSTAGWMATTVNYLWPFSFGVLSFIPLINKSYGKKTSLPEYLIAIIGLIFATNHEQSCLLIIGLNALYLFNSIINKEEINKFNLLAIVVGIFGLIFFLTCPGVPIRVAKAIPEWYPGFDTLGLRQKIYLGTIPTINLLLENKIVILLFYGLLNIYTILKTEQKYLKIIAGFNIGLILCLTIFKQILFNVIPGLQKPFLIFIMHTVPHMTERPVIVVIAISVYLILSSCYLLYKAFDNNLFPPVLFLAGFLSRFMLGFSPTVFASSTRTALYFYMILIMLILMIIKRLYDEDRIDERWEIIITATLAVLAVLNYFNTLILTNTI